MNYEGRAFRSSAAETASGGATPVGRYHQRGDLVWAEFSGGAVRTGRLVGRSAPDGVLTAAYCQVLDDGRTVGGEVVSTPEFLADGRIRLREEWRRADGSTGTSWVEEIR
ncbi:hypothetical protein NGB36_27650 [Streptomyces sp. RB6PN25]|uniref:N-acetylglutamate synthase n=1 Tax=Streptomyces humicola TaxID=2953240 RepID=A0ABT1Q2Y5_9ACTN|nr:hypothetical protein [Streptomyces humicola]MCQ4084249.1 hypothetical protein [Streptomyces humicola]